MKTTNVCTDFAKIWRALVDSPWSYRLGRWSLAVVMLFSAGLKLTDVRGLAGLISDYGLVPEVAVDATALALITLELLAGLGLALDVRGGLALVCGLLLLFMAVLAYGIALGLEIECGCFGIGEHEQSEGSSPVALVRDLVLLSLCGYLYRFRVRNGVRPRDIRMPGRYAFKRDETSKTNETQG